MTPEQYGIVAILIAIGISGAAGKWVFGWVYKAMEHDRNFWRTRYLSALGLAEMATDHAAKADDEDA